MKNKLAKMYKIGAATVASAYATSQLAVVRALDIGQQIGGQPGYATQIGPLINFILRLVLIIGALLVFAYLILGGIEYITSGGEKGKTEAARNKITAAVIGLLILAASWAVFTLILQLFGLGDLNHAIQNIGTISGAS